MLGECCRFSWLLLGSLEHEEQVYQSRASDRKIHVKAPSVFRIPASVQAILARDMLSATYRQVTVPVKPPPISGPITEARPKTIPKMPTVGVKTWTRLLKTVMFGYLETLAFCVAGPLES